MRGLSCVSSILTSIRAFSGAEETPCIVERTLEHEYFNPENCCQMKDQVKLACTIGDKHDYGILSCTNTKCGIILHEGCVVVVKIAEIKVQIRNMEIYTPSVAELKRILILECPFCSSALDRQLADILLSLLEGNGVDGVEVLDEICKLTNLPALFRMLYSENISFTRYEQVYNKICDKENKKEQVLKDVIADVLLLKKLPLANPSKEIYETLPKVFKHDGWNYTHSPYFYYSLFMFYFSTEKSLEENFVFIGRALKIIETDPPKWSTAAECSLFTAFFDSKLNSENIYAIFEHFAFTPLAQYLKYVGHHKFTETKDIDMERIVKILLKNIKTKKWFLEDGNDFPLTCTFFFVERMESFGANNHYTFIEGVAKHIVGLSPAMTYKGYDVQGSKPLKKFISDLLSEKIYEPLLVKNIADMIISSNGYPWFFYDFALYEYIKLFGDKLNLFDCPRIFTKIVKKESQQNSKKITYAWLEKYFKDDRFKSEKVLLSRFDLLCSSKLFSEKHNKVEKYSHTAHKIPVVKDYLNCVSSCLDAEDSVNKLDMDLKGLLLRHIYDSPHIKICFDKAVQEQSDESIMYLVRSIHKHSKFATGLDASFVTDYQVFKDPKMYSRSFKILREIPSSKLDIGFKALIAEKRYDDVQKLTFALQDNLTLDSLTAEERNKILQPLKFRDNYEEIFNYLCECDTVNPALCVLFDNLFDLLPNDENLRCYFSSRMLKLAKIHQVKEKKFIYNMFKKIMQSESPEENVMAFMLSISKEQRYFLNDTMATYLANRGGNHPLREDWIKDFSNTKTWLLDAASKFKDAEGHWNSYFTGEIIMKTLRVLPGQLYYYDILGTLFYQGTKLLKCLKEKHKGDFEFFKENNIYVDKRTIEILKDFSPNFMQYQRI
ncbi:hypothetical protein ENBRE01_1124 [Enteropsectra breve]|nr:hypothetical protein ENBRE01_1124 [Enteropsectra breve]